jgi:hypothetical protein
MQLHVAPTHKIRPQESGHLADYFYETIFFGTSVHTSSTTRIAVVRGAQCWRAKDFGLIPAMAHP